MNKTINSKNFKNGGVKWKIMKKSLKKERGELLNILKKQQRVFRCSR